jgi:hypothetical protein
MAEGWAADPAGAGALVEKGEVKLEPANHHDTVIPMASALGPSAWVWIVENRDGGNRAFSGINQGPLAHRLGRGGRRSSIVVGIARNGTTFGVRLTGSDEWHVAPAPPVSHALYHSGQGPETSAPDIGDSALLELVGLGGPAAAGSPAVAGPVAVDVRRVVETGITPRINTGILHRSDGSGQVGAGVAVAPVECFRSALPALDRKLAS